MVATISRLAAFELLGFQVGVCWCFDEQAQLTELLRCAGLLVGCEAASQRALRAACFRSYHGEAQAAQEGSADLQNHIRCAVQVCAVSACLCCVGRVELAEIHTCFIDCCH